MDAFLDEHSPLGSSSAMLWSALTQDHPRATRVRVKCIAAGAIARGAAVRSAAARKLSAEGASCLGDRIGTRSSQLPLSPGTPLGFTSLQLVHVDTTDTTLGYVSNRPLAILRVSELF